MKQPHPPLGYNHKQPVTYHRVTLLQPALEGYLVGQHIPVLQVDWVKGTAQTFDDPDDALNGVCSFQGLWTCTETVPETVQQYVTETLRFLKRGHSLLHPQCTCQHWLSPQRCSTLGINAQPMNGCTLSRAPVEISAAELSKELAVDDVCLMPGAPFIFALEQLCTIRVAPEGLFFSPRGIFLGPVRQAHIFCTKNVQVPLP